MSLNPEQLQTLQNDIATNPELTTFLAASDVNSITSYYKQDSTFVVNKSTTPISDIQNATIFANFTPANPAVVPTNAIDVVAAVNNLIGAINQQNMLLACQGKQFNFQNILAAAGFGGQIATGKPNIVAGLQDACSQIPSGVNGANKSGGWLNGIQLVIQRLATNGEKIFATGVGTIASPGHLVFDGAISQTEISSVMFNDDGTRKI